MVPHGERLTNLARSEKRFQKNLKVVSELELSWNWRMGSAEGLRHVFETDGGCGGMIKRYFVLVARTSSSKCSLFFYKGQKGK
jgi:hypothetical protein